MYVHIYGYKYFIVHLFLIIIFQEILKKILSETSNEHSYQVGSNWPSGFRGED
jgi:hypothetical protein